MDTWFPHLPLIKNIKEQGLDLIGMVKILKPRYLVDKKSEWLAILSTDCSLNDQGIINIYCIRWDIEVFFKTKKSLLKL
jgi:hypothetical protein